MFTSVRYRGGLSLFTAVLFSLSAISTSAAEAPAETAGIGTIARFGELGVRCSDFNLGVPNPSSAMPDDFAVHDTLPSGFQYRTGSARFVIARPDGTAAAPAQSLEPGVNATNVVFPVGALPASSRVAISYSSVVRPSTQPGEFLSRGVGVATSGGERRSTAPGPVRATVTRNAFLRTRVLIGRVFEDLNENEKFDSGGPGVPGVEIVTSSGLTATTDPSGQYNLAGLAAGSGVVAIDPATLPARLQTPSPGVAVDVTKAGRKAYLESNYAEAEQYFRVSWQQVNSGAAGALARVQVAASLAQVLSSAGRFEEAESLFDEAKRTAEKEEDVPTDVHAILLANLAAVYMQTDRVDRAESALKKARALLQDLEPESAPMVSILKNLGGVESLRGRIKQAGGYLTKALEMAEKVPNMEPGELASVMTSLGALYALRKKWSQAEGMFRQAVDVLEKAYGHDHSGVSDALYNLAQMYGIRGDFVRAESTMREVLRIRQKAFGVDSMAVAGVSSRLAVAVTRQGRYDEAKALFQSALAIQERTIGTMSPGFLETLENYGILMRLMEDSAQAEVIENRAKDIRAELMFTVSTKKLPK